MASPSLELGSSDPNLNSNNPYRKQAASRAEDSEKQVVEEQQTPLDSEKQVVEEWQTPFDSEKQVAGSESEVRPNQQRFLDSEKQVVGSEDQLEKGQQRSLDSEKQVVSTDGSDAPMVVAIEESSEVKPPPVREADKEVVSSWQSKSGEESAPIPMAYHESQSSPGTLLNDVKGPPPAYDSAVQRTRSEDDDLVSTPSPIEPDSPVGPPKPEDRSVVGQLVSWIPTASKSKAQMPALLQPIVIPQLDVPPRGESVPFVRCYSDALASHDVSMRDFTSFLDGLAVSQSPNSALQGLKVFGAGVSHVPLPIIPLAGKGLAALATSGSGHSGSRARLYIERAKNEYFAPRGLRLSIVKDLDLNARLQMPTHASRIAPLTRQTLNESVSKRRMEAIAPYVAPLRFDVPEKDVQTQGVHKLARKHQDLLFRNEGKRVMKLREEQWRNIETSLGAMETGQWERRYTSKMSELRHSQLEFIRVQGASKQADEKSPEVKEMEDSLRQDQRQLQIMMTERQMAFQNLGRGGRGVEAEMEEIELCRRLKWIVIENLK